MFDSVDVRLRAVMQVTVQLTMLLLVFAGARPDEAAGQQGRLTGRVVSAESGQPISGAVVRVADETRWTATANDGSYRLVVSAGQHVVSLEALGYRATTLEADVPAGGSTTLDVRLETRPLALEGIQVSTLRPDLSPTAKLEGRAVEEANPKDSGELLRAMDGVDAVRRGPLGLDPVVRGLRETEVGTYLDGTRLFPAGPARMDSPLTHLDPSAVRSIEVVKGPYALTWGAGNLSAIRVETQPLPDAESTPHGSVSAGYDTNLQASETSGKAYGREGPVGYFLHGAWREGGDYESGGGESIPGDFESWDVRGKLSVELDESSDLGLSIGYQEQGPIDYPGRLLTADFFQSLNLSARYDFRPAEGALRDLSIQLYRNDVEHGMDNTGKPTRMSMPGRMPPFALDVQVESGIEVTGYRAAAELAVGEATTLEVGSDLVRTNRDATRFIRRLDNGMLMFEDMMWPDATISDLGGFGRLAWSNDVVRLSGTTRVDFVSAEAPTASDFFLDNVGRDLTSYETNVSAAATASFDVDEAWTLALGLGSAVRTADASERYSDRIPASKAQTPAEFMGNPDLDPERSTQGDVWIDGSFTDFAVHVGAFARRIDDYITIAPTSLPKRLPLSPDIVFQYVNGEATFYGLDASATIGLGPVFTLDARASYLWGRDDALDEPAIGVAPMSGSLGLRYEEEAGRLYLEAILNATAEQTRVSTSRNEGPTDGYATGDVKAGFGLGNGVTLRTGILNVWDEAYHNHLNARNPFTGQPVPEPGRIFFLDASWSY